jgi:cell division protein FtsN
MARDYKYRANQSKKKPQQTSVAWWKWLLIIALVAIFVFFLLFLSNSAPDIIEKQSTKKISIVKKSSKPKVIAKRQNSKPKQPRFDFYTILPETEVVVPDYEIKTRSREEQFGKAKPTQYIMQVGAFRAFSEADKLRARLGLLGIESRVEKAKVGNVTWNRVKMGPFNRPSNVSALKTKLSRNNIDVIVTELKNR